MQKLVAVEVNTKVHAFVAGDGTLAEFLRFDPAALGGVPAVNGEHAAALANLLVTIEENFGLGSPIPVAEAPARARTLPTAGPERALPPVRRGGTQPLGYERIGAYVAEHPGERVPEIAQGLRLTAIQAKSHLNRAEAHGLIARADSGRWYKVNGHGGVVPAPTGKPQRGDVIAVEARKARLLEVIRANPGSRKSTLCELAGLTSVSWNHDIVALKADGAVRKEGWAQAAYWYAT